MEPEQIKDALMDKFQLEEGACEWHSFPGVHNQYSPRTDIAIGHFSMEKDETKTTEHNNSLNNPKVLFFLKEIYDHHWNNVGHIGDHVDANECIEVPEFDEMVKVNFNINSNARCFIAIEFDNTTSNKHILGSMVNAAALGRVGICVADSDAAFNRFITQLNYLWFIKNVKQMNFEVRNLLIVKKAQLETVVTNLLNQP